MDGVDIDNADEVDNNEDSIEETVPEVCRVCLLGHVIMRDLFVENEIVSLSTKAMSFASVKMLPEDGLPAQVCCECADKLDAAYEFKLQVEQADNVLRQRYDTLNIKEELFFNEVEVHLEAERDEVHSLDVDAHYQATVDSLNAAEAEDEDKPSLLKDHLALLAVQKLAKQGNVLHTDGKDEDVMNDDTGVSGILEADDDDHHTHYMHDDETNVEELPDCDQHYDESMKAESMHDPDGITAEEHNYIMQQGYALTRNEEALVAQESVDSVDNESVHYLSLIEEQINGKEELDQAEISHNVKSEEHRKQQQQQQLEHLQPQNQQFQQEQEQQNQQQQLEQQHLQNHQQLEQLHPQNQQLEQLHPQNQQLEQLHPQNQQLEQLDPQNQQLEQLHPQNQQLEQLHPQNQEQEQQEQQQLELEQELLQLQQQQQQQHENDQQEQEECTTIKTEISPNEMRRSKRKLSKTKRNTDEESYFENLNLSSRLKRSQTEKTDKCYFLCYLCDKQFVSKEILKEHMHCHVEVRRALSLKNSEKIEKRLPSPAKLSPTPSATSSMTTTTTPTSSPIVRNVVSGKKANKCPYCGKEYLYVISYDKHIKQHERSKETTRDAAFVAQDDDDEADCSSDFVNYDEERNTEMKSRIEASNDDDDEDETLSHSAMNSSVLGPTRKKRRRRNIGSEKTTYSCDKCSEKFTDKHSLIDHANEHFGSFCCSTCEREFDGLEKLRRHRSEHVVEGVLSEQDLEDDAYERDYETQMPENAENEIYQSVELPQSQNDPTMMQQGEDNEDDAEEDGEDDDDDDDREGNGDGSWKLEIEPSEDINEDIKDEIGSDEISDNWGLTSELKCPNCGLTCTSKRALNRHIETHVETREICKLCKMEFSQSEQLQRHVEQNHGNRVKSFKCTECNKIFGNELTLRNHLFATNHKTIIQGQQYDPNKRLKRVAAKAAQKIIDKIKSEDDFGDYEDDKEKVKEELMDNAEEGNEDNEDNEDDDDDDDYDEEKDEITESQNTRINEGRWSRHDERKFQERRNRRKCDYECEFCGRKCSSKKSLSKHVDQHRCKDVKLKTLEKSRKNETMEGTCKVGTSTMKHHDETIEDDTIDDNSDFESGLDWPIDIHECLTCKKKYSTKKSLLRHQLLHEEPNFECDICNVKFYRKDKLKSHYDKCSEKNPDQVRKCNICGDTFDNNDILKEHRARHVDEGILTEEDLRDIEPGGIDEGRESSKVARKRRTDIVGLECTECNKRYTSRKGLLRHIQVHEGKKYLCDICPKKFYRREHLNIHVVKHNMIKPYKCPRCTKRFIKEEQLSSHLSKHDRTFKKPKETDTPKRFLCEICSKSFTQSTTLIAHLRAHNGIKPYVCEVCARPFTTNAYLKMHMRTHTQERPYSCQYCLRAFARADTLANHLTSHTGEAKYHCKYCPKNFRRLKSLKEHVFIHTGQRPYACPTCDRRFNNNGSRYAHSKRCKQSLLQNQTCPPNTISTNTIVQNTMPHPIRLHQVGGSQQFISHQDGTQMQLVKSANIKTITITRPVDQITGVLQHQEMLMPLILPLTVTLTDVDEEVILPEGTKIFTTA